MQINVLYRPSQALAQVWLQAGEAVMAEAGAMVGMTPNVNMQTQSGGLGKSLMRALGGESFFRNTFTSQGGNGEVLFAPPLCGDGPLIRPATLNRLLDRHREAHAAASIATAVLDDATGYGRIYRDAARMFKAIVEQKICTPEQLKIREVNPSYYCFDLPELFRALDRVKKNPLSGEYYLTDTLELLLADGRAVEVIEAVPPEDVLSINTPDDLAKVDSIYRSRPPVTGVGVNSSTSNPAKAGPR